jgi:probable HAF family extracellular repeat protein
MRKPLFSALVAIIAWSMPVASATASQLPAYSMTDVGTLGGAQAQLQIPGVPITNQGTVIGTADTTATDSDYPNNGPCGSDPQIQHAFSWQNGRMTDLGALPGNNCSAIAQTNGRGVGAGFSETGADDPLTATPAIHPVAFHDGRLTDLGTLPRGTEGFAVAINDRGQIAGMSNNGTPDPFGFPLFFSWVTETRSFIWQDNTMRDLGTLGGPDTVMTTLNAHGQIAGDSYTNDTPNSTTGVPSIDPFLWTDGHIQDLGTLGGNQSTTWWLNDSGEVVGQDNLAGDQSFHPFLWDGRRLRDLGTFGGNFGNAYFINNAGEVVGWATTPGDATAHAFLWKDRRMTDLTGSGSPDCTVADRINSSGVIVGETCAEDDALLWEAGRQYDLNTLVPPSDVHLTVAQSINDRGQIVALGQLPNGNQHIFVLTPDPRRLQASVAAVRRTSTTHMQHDSPRPPARRAEHTPRARWWQLSRTARLRTPTLAGAAAASLR